MVYNPVTQLWEGNSTDLLPFEQKARSVQFAATKSQKPASGGAKAQKRKTAPASTWLSHWRTGGL
jgi:hypothetical protein